nr:MAG TPA: hypothetical protein [Caudoviricetes sp.]
MRTGRQPVETASAVVGSHKKSRPNSDQLNQGGTNQKKKGSSIVSWNKGKSK